jgi:hypothetical protein
MIKILDQKTYISMDEYYVIQFYQMKPTIKYYLMKTFMCNMYIILYVMYFISFKHMLYYVIFTIYFYIKQYWFEIFCCKFFYHFIK